MACNYLRGETEARMLIGLLKKLAVPGIHINCFGVILKTQ